MRDGRGLPRGHVGVEEPVGRVDAEVVGQVEDVRDEHTLERGSLQTKIDVAERNRMSVSGGRSEQQDERSQYATRQRNQRTPRSVFHSSSGGRALSPANARQA